MDDDKRDELLIRLDERTRVISGDVKDFKTAMAEVTHRLDKLEAKSNNSQRKPPQSGESGGKWVTFMEFMAAAPVAFHVITVLLVSCLGFMGVAFTWAYNHLPKAGGFIP